MGADRTDDDWMGAALALARRGLGETWPNPSVGCVIVKDGRLIGRGRTQPGGRPHAEVMALAQAGEAAVGSTVYVTLEPCSHHGKSPPCTDALIAAKIARVVVAQSDPNPEVDGLAALKAAGIEVKIGVCEEQAATVNRGFVSQITASRPFVRLKIAATLDGKIATRTGESRWITGPEARRRVHMMRAECDAVLIGRGTAMADDPMLDVRDLGALNNPVRVVLDSGLSMPTDMRLITSADRISTWIVHKTGATPAKAHKACKLIEAEDLGSALNALGAEGLTSVFCEGGATLAASLLKGGYVDEMVVFTAGKVIGGEGLSAIGDMGIDAITAALKFELKSFEAVGADTMSVWARTG